MSGQFPSPRQRGYFTHGSFSSTVEHPPPRVSRASSQAGRGVQFPAIGKVRRIKRQKSGRPWWVVARSLQLWAFPPTLRLGGKSFGSHSLVRAMCQQTREPHSSGLDRWEPRVPTGDVARVGCMLREGALETHRECVALTQLCSLGSPMSRIGETRPTSWGCRGIISPSKEHRNPQIKGAPKLQCTLRDTASQWNTDFRGRGWNCSPPGFLVLPAWLPSNPTHPAHTLPIQGPASLGNLRSSHVAPLMDRWELLIPLYTAGEAEALEVRYGHRVPPLDHSALGVAGARKYSSSQDSGGTNISRTLPSPSRLLPPPAGPLRQV